jgi:hypothetical protein
MLSYFQDCGYNPLMLCREIFYKYKNQKIISSRMNLFAEMIICLYLGID